MNAGRLECTVSEVRLGPVQIIAYHNQLSIVGILHSFLQSAQPALLRGGGGERQLRRPRVRIAGSSHYWMKLRLEFDQNPVAPNACFTLGWKRYQRIHA